MPFRAAAWDWLKTQPREKVVHAFACRCWWYLWALGFPRDRPSTPESGSR